MANWNRTFSGFSQALERRSETLAILGDGQGNLETSQSGYYWARMFPDQTLVRVRCDHVMPFAGSYVWVRKSPHGAYYEATKADPLVAEQFFDGLPAAGSAANVGMHAWAHKGPVGPDVVWVDGQQILPGLVRPASPADLTVDVLLYRYIDGDDAPQYVNANLDLTSYVPNTGYQRLIIVCLDMTTNALSVVQGATTGGGGQFPFLEGAGPVPFDDDDIDAVSIVFPNMPLAAVRLYGDQTSIVWTDVWREMRELSGYEFGRVRITSGDEGREYLEDKLIAGTGVTVSKSTDGDGVETLILSSAGAGSGGWDVDEAPINPGSIDDEFNNSAIDPAWTEYDPDSIQTASEDTERIRLTQTDQTGTAHVTGYYKALPSGDFTLVCKTKIDVAASTTENALIMSGLVMWEDASDSSDPLHIIGPYARYFSSTAYSGFAQAAFTDHDTLDTLSASTVGIAADTWYYVRIRRTGTTYFYDVSEDGETWSTYPAIVGFTPAYVGIGAICFKAGSNLNADFDFFRYRDEYDSAGDPVYGRALGAPADAQYVVLATNDTLTSERVLTAGDALTATDAGAGGALTLDVNADDTTIQVNGSDNLEVIPGGVDHGSLAGLADDDHSQYHNDTRGDVRYYQQSEHINTSAGAGDAGKPIKLDASGEVDGTMIPDLPASQITSGTLTHERGGLEADVSAYSGYPLISGGSTSEIKCNLAASAAPGASDDSTAGYVVGSQWFDTTNDKAYVCLDATASAAVWTEITGGGGGSGTVTSVGLALPTDVFDVTGSPVTASGTLTAAFDNQDANEVFAGPTSGSAATPAFRSLDNDDLPTPGAYAVITDWTTLSSAAASISITSISSSYTTLILDLLVRSDYTTAAFDQLILKLNSDATTSNYASGLEYSGTHYNYTGYAGLTLGLIASNSATSNQFTPWRIVFHNYSSTSLQKIVSGDGTFVDSTPYAYFLGMGGVWTNTANAISRIDITANGGSNLVAGTKYLLRAY